MINVTLSESEQKVIDVLYKHFRETGKWIGVRTLHQRLGRKIVMDVVSRRKPKLIIIFEDNESGIEYYKLTFLGIYLCPKAKDDIGILYRYLNLLKQKFKENPEIREITSWEVETSLNLTKEQSKRLRDLILISRAWGGGASHAEEWRFGVPDDIEDLVDMEDPDEYLEKNIEKREKKIRKIEKSKSRRLDMYRVGFWAFFTIVLWREFFDVVRYFHEVLPYYVVLIIWFTLFSMTKIMEILKIPIPFFSTQRILEKIWWWIITIIISAAAGLVIRFLSK